MVCFVNIEDTILDIKTANFKFDKYSGTQLNTNETPTKDLTFD